MFSFPEIFTWRHISQQYGIQDVAILSHNNLNFWGIPFTIGL